MLFIERSFINDIYLCRMMKKTFTYLFILVMSALIFYGGAGINVISYCCDKCRSAGIEVVSDHKCCEMHKHHHEHHAAANPSCEKCIEHTDDMCCGLKRLKHDWNNQNVSDSELDIEPVAIDLLYAGTCNISTIPLLSAEENLIIMATGPPLKIPRAYLSLLTTLLI